MMGSHDTWISDASVNAPNLLDASGTLRSASDVPPTMIMLARTNVACELPPGCGAVASELLAASPVEDKPLLSLLELLYLTLAFHAFHGKG